MSTFYEIETPILNRSTRKRPGTILCLASASRSTVRTAPVSTNLQADPDDRRNGSLFQICRCFRDEDLRGPSTEFTQIDIEMSFVTQNMLMELG